MTKPSIFVKKMRLDTNKRTIRSASAKDPEQFIFTPKSQSNQVKVVTSKGKK